MLDLKNKYNREDLLLFLKDFLPDDHLAHEKAQDLPLDHAKSITNAVVLSECKSLGIKIFEVEHSGSKDARVSLAREAFRIMADTLTNRALVVFKSSDSSQWRLSLMTIQLDYDETRNKIKKSFSNARRYSYLLGQEAKINTPYKYLISLGKVKDVGDLEKRFSIEVVNNEFYKEIAKLYDELIGTEEITRKLTYPSSGNESHEFAVRLIGRIIFCWFLREKKSESGLSLVPKDVLSREASGEAGYYHTVLAPLFFEVLNKPIQRRSSKFQTGNYKDIPYLNGGLFSDDNIDYYKFDKGLELSVPGLVDVPDQWLHNLFDLLERFNFTVDENTSYDTDLSIDPEMLGRVFENLLARINPETGETVRKSTGSFYTPREIVEYMVDASLSEYLVSKTGVNREKINALISYDLFDDLENELNKEEGVSVLEALSILTVLDPACGSGAFPIGMLQKIVFIITKLDPDTEWWLAKQLEGASPELRREFANRSVDYVRKLGIIRQTIFGVDIQPIATEISRLRCFLTLIVDEAVDDTQENRGIRPLPNLDFKFVTANSLITLPKPEDKKGDISDTQAAMFEETSHIDELRQIRNEYFSSTNHERNELESRFNRLQKKMVLTNVDVFRGSASKLYDTLSRWDPFEYKPSAWFDSGWMFGVETFDIIIANPPYVDSETMVNNSPEFRELLKEIYTTTKGNWDLFIPFVEKGLYKTKKNGVLVYIVPNKIIGAKYSTTLREFINTLDLIEVRDYSRMNVFEEGDVYPVTLAIRNSKKGEDGIIFKMMESYTNVKRQNVAQKADLVKDVLWDKYFLDPREYKLVSKLLRLKKLKDVPISILGAATVGEAYEIKKHIEDSSRTKGSKRLINTGTIDRYISLWGLKPTQYIKRSYSHPIISNSALENINPIRLKQASQPKIIVAGMSDSIEAFFDIDGSYIAGKSTSIFLGDSKSLIYYLAILNSKLTTYFVSTLYHSLKMAGGYLNINKNILENLPIPDKDNSISRSIEEKVTMIIDHHSSSISSKEKIAKLENELDQLIYKLYTLTPGEIQIIEESTQK